MKYSTCSLNGGCSKDRFAKDFPKQTQMGPFLCFTKWTSYLNYFSAVLRLYKLPKARVANPANGSLKPKITTYLVVNKLRSFECFQNF